MVENIARPSINISPHYLKLIKEINNEFEDLLAFIFGQGTISTVL
jgi:hypothetical protein